MKKKNICLLLFLTLIISFGVNAQFRIGGYSGTNFSNLHGNLREYRWTSKSGTSFGLWGEYQFCPSWSIHSEIGYIAYYYKQIQDIEDTYQEGTGIYNYPGDWYIPYTGPRMWDFNYLRIPMLLKYHFSSKYDLSLGAGGYYSFLINDEYTGKERDIISEANKQIPSKDFGFLFDLSVSYPLTEKLALVAQSRYVVGKKQFVRDYEGRNGGPEVNIGLSYQLGRKLHSDQKWGNKKDTITSKWRISPKIAYSYNRVQENRNSEYYVSNPGFSAGLTFEYPVGKITSLAADLLFERKGYGVEGPTNLDFRYFIYSPPTGNDKIINTTVVDLDYLSIPFYLKLGQPNTNSLFMNIGGYVSFNINASCKGNTHREIHNTNSYSSTTYYVYKSVEGYYKTMDAGLLFGMGYQAILFKKLIVQCEGRYTVGLNNIIEDEAFTFSTNEQKEKFKNHSLSIFVGITLPNSSK